MAKQDKLNRLYAQILKIDEDGKDFLTNILTKAGANRSFAGMPVSIRELADENEDRAVKGRADLLGDIERVG
jgi:hypothetical protein